MRLLSLFLILVSSLSAQAAVRCEAIFAGGESLWSKPIDPKAYAGELSEARLKQNGFRIDPKGNLYVLKYKKGKDLKLGQVKTLSVDYLFEWADKKNSDAWIKAGRIDYMDAILEEAGQQSGKGYYVSVDPVDSSGYGTHLTSFRQNKKIIFLQYIYETPVAEISYLMKEDTKFVRRLALAGIDALQLGDNYTKNWYSVISERLLQKAEPLTKDFLEDYLNNFLKSGSYNDMQKAEVFALLPKFKDLLRSFPLDNPYRRFTLYEKMSAKEIFDAIFTLPTYATDEFAFKLLRHSKRLVYESRTAEDLLAALRVQKFANNAAYLEVLKTRSPAELQRLAEFEAFAKQVESHTLTLGPDVGVLTRTRLEVLRNWILDAKTKEEASSRMQRAQDAILKTYEDFKNMTPELQQAVG